MKLVSLQALNSETPVAPFRLHEVNRAEVSLQRRSRDPYGSAVIHSVGSGSPVFLVPGGGAHGDGPWFGGRESGTSRNVLEKFSSPLQVFILGARRLRLPPPSGVGGGSVSFTLQAAPAFIGTRIGKFWFGLKSRRSALFSLQTSLYATF